MRINLIITFGGIVLAVLGYGIGITLKLLIPSLACFIIGISALMYGLITIIRDYEILTLREVLEKTELSPEDLRRRPYRKPAT